jgi:hypothetical protein
VFHIGSHMTGIHCSSWQELAAHGHLKYALNAYCVRACTARIRPALPLDTIPATRDGSTTHVDKAHSRHSTAGWFMWRLQ